jgi:hypothetical protein
MTSLDSAVAQANAEVAEMLGSIGARRQYTVSKFGVHADGYLHARVVVNGKPYYFHLRYGSWQAPGQVGNRQVHKEPEAVLGSTLGREVKYTLAEMARRLRRRREEKDDGGDTGASEDAGSVRATGSADRVQPEGDDQRPDGEVPPDAPSGDGPDGADD